MEVVIYTRRLIPRIPNSLMTPSSYKILLKMRIRSAKIRLNPILEEKLFSKTMIICILTSNSIILRTVKRNQASLTLFTKTQNNK